MNKYRVFISYTLREHGISIEHLQLLKLYFSQYDVFETYIDILDNCGTDHQAYVEDQLRKSDVVLLIQSDGIASSEWVEKELKIARTCCIPIQTLPLDQVLSITNAKTSTEAKEKVKTLIQLLQARISE